MMMKFRLHHLIVPVREYPKMSIANRLLRTVILSFCIYSVCIFSKEIPIEFPVFTYINKSKFYDYSLNISLVPNNPVLEYDDENKKFKDKIIDVLISTDIPKNSDLGFEYNLRLVSNESRCENFYDDSLFEKDIIKLYLDGKIFEYHKPALNNKLDSNDSSYFLSGKNELIMKSKLIDASAALRCSGTISIETELAL